MLAFDPGQVLITRQNIGHEGNLHKHLKKKV